MNPTDPLTEHFRLKTDQVKALKKLGIEVVRDLLFHFPSRYGDVARVTTIDSLKDKEHAQIFGRVKKLETKKSFRSKVPMAEATIEDDTGTVKAVWFHQPYIAKMIKEGATVRVEGEVSEPKNKENGKPGFTNPEIEAVSRIPTGVGDSLFAGDIELYAQPVYPESKGVTSRWLFHAIQKVMRAQVLDGLIDPIPEKIRERYHLPDLQTSLIWIHTPQKKEHADSARKRFAFEEIFFIQIKKQLTRKQYEKHPTFRIDKTYADLSTFIDSFPFTPTGAQERSIKQILDDFTKDYAMSRLLEGDVGSGKTFVAAVTAKAVIDTRPDKDKDFGNLQVAYMAPTEVLARQHFESFKEFFAGSGIKLGLITGSGCEKFPSKSNPNDSTNISRKKLLQWVANGEIPILIGTHSLVYDSVAFENLAYVIVDEQHRFGTLQRAKLRKKEDDVFPHLLSMTATPIPRTLALTMYGDLDLTLLDEMPKERKSIKTAIVPPNKRANVYAKIHQELKAGRQLYVICPRIDEPDPDKEQTILAKSVTEEAKRLKKEVFPDYEIEIMHSKMTPKEKNDVMEQFDSGEVDILVSTSVVEVGVNVPNATMIIIEGAERFGLAQLHQLRGRVMRGAHQSYCFVFTDSGSQKTKDRLGALKKAKNGFELAEYDLAQRGAGELAGRKQSGISDLGMEAIKNIKMVEAAREEAKTLVEQDEALKKYPLLRERIASKSTDIHFE
ncbi:MAG: ATP-dependent DNA helicase RecG [Candidatus Paceibacterota bacterium]